MVFDSCKNHTAARKERMRQLMTNKASVRRASASAYSHTQRIVQRTCNISESDHIQVATSCLETTRIGCIRGKEATGVKYWRLILMVMPKVFPCCLGFDSFTS